MSAKPFSSEHAGNRGPRACAAVALAVACLVLLAACGGDTTPARSTPVSAPTGSAFILRVGERKIDGAAFARLLGPPPQRRERKTEHERRSEFLEELERTVLLTTRAQELGYFEQPQVRAARKNAMVQQLLQDLFGDTGSARTPVTDADVQAYYEAHLGDFTSPEQVRVSQILVSTHKQAAALIAQLQAHPEQHAQFPELASKHSIDASTKTRGGDLGSFALAPPPAVDAQTSASLRPRYIPVPVRQAAFTLQQPGAVYPTPVRSELGFHVLMLLSRRPVSRYQLAQVQHVLHEKLETERRDAAMEALVTQLQTSARLQLHTDKLALVRVAP